MLVYWEQEASLSTVPPAHVKGELVVEEVCEVVTQQKSILAKQLLLVSQCNIACLHTNVHVSCLDVYMYTSHMDTGTKKDMKMTSQKETIAHLMQSPLNWKHNLPSLPASSSGDTVHPLPSSNRDTVHPPPSSNGTQSTLPPPQAEM